MLIGIPKEIKNHEYRVGLTPSSPLDVGLARFAGAAGKADKG